VLFFGDDHGREAVVGRRDAYWASGGFAVTNSLLLSAGWVVGAVFADRNTPALGGILNQQGVGNSTVSCFKVVWLQEKITVVVGPARDISTAMIPTWK